MTEPSPRQPDAESERPIWGEHPSAPEAGFDPDDPRLAGLRSDDPRFAGYRPTGYPGPASGGLRFGFPVAARPDSEAALRQYLLTRALGRSVMNTVQWSAIAILLLAAGCWLIGLKVLAVLIGIVAMLVLLFRSLLSAIGRRLSGADRLGPVEPQVRRLVARTGRGLRRELRRAGLPGTPWAPLLILLRLMRPYRRRQTAQALARVDLNRVVPASQLDELHLLLQSAGRLGGNGTP
jgi:hypothetical protein